MTTHDVYDRYHGDLWRAWNVRFKATLRNRYPRTDGIGLYVHNWIVCGRDPIESARALTLITDQWARWRRISTRGDREYRRIEHETQHGDHFRPLWCARCTP